MNRPQEIIEQYLNVLNAHIEELKNGRAESTFEIKDFAAALHIHPTHLSNTINEQLGKSPCDIYEEKLIETAKELILTTDKSIAEIARTMTYDPSNFSKFFKSFEKVTPLQFRKNNAVKF